MNNKQDVLLAAAHILLAVLGAVLAVAILRDEFLAEYLGWLMLGTAGFSAWRAGVHWTRAYENV